MLAFHVTDICRAAIRLHLEEFLEVDRLTLASSFAARFWSPPFSHAARTAYPARGCELATIGAGPDDRRFVVRKDSGHRYEIADLAVDHADQGADRRLVEVMRHIFTFLEQRDVTAAQAVAGSPKGGGALAAAESAGEFLANDVRGWRSAARSTSRLVLASTRSQAKESERERS
ncbi:hypothetical protein MA20_44265 [Bradyrhizobium japonicum]|uniref:Uncharacterized protein n=1 Tax=Bradyrhizobium japonicum TaxID=375 RepID=A0A0A3YI96_BRAJP|nr:hypothetical protein MA20_44265 [Bradyrhizobium japonicum]